MQSLQTAAKQERIAAPLLIMCVCKAGKSQQFGSSPNLMQVQSLQTAAKRQREAALDNDDDGDDGEVGTSARECKIELAADLFTLNNLLPTVLLSWLS